MAAPPARSSLHYSATWRLDATLRDGTRAELRLIGPGDAPLLADGFARLSAESRFRRFLMPKGALTAAELRYLTELDGWDHVAIGAVALTGRLLGHGLGVARCVRMLGEPQVAEAAVAVADDCQGLGLGRLLMDHLTEAARERDVTVFRVSVLADNLAMLHLSGDPALVGLQADAAGVVHLDLPLPPPSERPHPHHQTLLELLRLAARKTLGFWRGSQPWG